jgi:hypothetical protein
MILEVNTTWTVSQANGSGGRTATGTGLGFDTSTLQLVNFNETRLLALLDPTPPNVQTPVGGLLHVTCAGTTLTEYFFGGGNSLTTTVTPNSPTCSYAPPLSCDLLAVTVSQVATPTGANVTAAFTGTVNGVAQYQLDGGTEQTSPYFAGAAPGPHTMQVRDDGLAGCARSLTFTVAPASTLPPAPTGPSQRIDFVGQPLWYPLAGQPVGALVELELWAESAHGATDFAPVLSLSKRVDAQGRVAFRLDTLLWPLLRAFVPAIALAAATQVCTTNLLDYYVRTTVTPLNPALPVAYDVSGLRTALRGGLPAEWQQTDYFALREQLAQLPFLSWQPTGPGIYADAEAKPIVPGQPEWLFFLCTPSLAGAQLQVSRSYRMSATARPVVDVEALPAPAGDWPYQLLAIPLRDTRASFATLTVQVETAAGVAVSLPAAYQFVARSEQTRFLLFTNSVGGLDTLRTGDRARLDVTLEATTEKVERPARLGEVAPAADRQVSDLSAGRKLRLATGWLEARELDWLQELVLSREVWQQVNAQLRPLDWGKRSLATYSDEPGLRGLLIECDYAYAPTAYAPVPYA